jgi:hypothetical protein
MNFEIVKQTKLRQKGELETLFAVSRPMVCHYLSGKSIPRGKNRSHIQTALTVLDKLVQQGKLPLPEDRDADQRMKAVEKILAHVKQHTSH